MTGQSRQLVLDLPHRAALGADDFLVSHSNRAAVELVDRWPDWGQASALVVGPRHAGKSHLAHVWRLRSGAAVRAAEHLEGGCIGELQRHGALVVEDLHDGIADEQMLFHLLNVAREDRLSLLLTSLRPPGELAIGLPDLRSRLRALPLVAIDNADEALLRAVLVKLFADRQLVVEPHVISYIGLHAERSLAAVARIVAEIDRAALATRRKPTRALAAEVLEHLARQGP